MSHEVETMAYSGEVPWHGLGVPVSNDLTVDEMMVAAGLDWEVAVKPLYINIGTAEAPELVYANWNGLVRSTDNKTLTTVGNDWNPVQNREGFEFMREFVEQGGMEMHTAGSLKGGRIVWILAKVKESFTLFGGDRIDAHLLFTIPHQYGKTVDIRSTPIRVVCDNTLCLARATDSKIQASFNHRKKFDPELVKERLGLVKRDMEKYKEQAVFLGSKKADETVSIEYLSRVFPSSGTEVSRSAKKAIAAIPFQPGANFAEGSWWQVFNAATYVFDHEVGRSNDTRMESSWYGGNQRKKVAALKMAVDYAKAA